MIEFKNVTKTFFKGTASEVKALNGISLKINSGEFVVLVGSNGSGKSTLMNALAGTIGIDRGEITIEENKVNHFKEYERSKWIARIFQNPLTGTAPELSVIDNFRLASLRTKRKHLKVGINADFKKLVKEKIQLLNLGLENKLDRAMGSLSGGQRQALTLLMAVMDESKIILLDEPTAALDPRTSEAIMKNADSIIRQFKLTAILITHHLKDAHQYGTRLIQMSEGKIIRDLSQQEKQKMSLIEMVEWF